MLESRKCYRKALIKEDWERFGGGDGGGGVCVCVVLNQFVKVASLRRWNLYTDLKEERAIGFQGKSVPNQGKARAIALSRPEKPLPDCSNQRSTRGTFKARFLESPQTFWMEFREI